ncbi:MAG TPA: hypothetical protein VMW61_01470 [Dehalococcoidales bacterium]|nr:hypothetical protein [Dehalococcoidales bacterium]
MRSLSSTLLAAQREASHTPYVKLEARNLISGVVRLDWTRLYNGSEDNYCHAVIMPGDGSLVRARITPSGDSRKLYRQRVANPGTGSDFSQWVYTNQYDAAVVACASLGAEVSIFWIDGVGREVYRIKSTDYGVNWGNPELIDYTPTTTAYGLAAAYKPNGDLALFFTDQPTLYVRQNVGGGWQSRSSWDKTTGDLSGVACVYDGDWNLCVSGQDSAGNYKLWSLIYGDGGDVAAGNWSDLKEFASAPAGGDFEYYRVFMDKPDVHRLGYVEKFTGTQGYQRPFFTYTVSGASFIDNLWREPVPLNMSSNYGLAMAHHGDYAWLSCPNGVWRAKLTEEKLDLSADLQSLRQEIALSGGSLTIELRNDDGRYASPGEGSLGVLDIGAQLDFSPGYRTTAGSEVSSGQSFLLGAYEHTSAGGKASLVLYATDGWGLVEAWRARHQFRWNKSSDQMSVKQLLEFVLARAGLKLEVVSQSSVITGFYPDFTIGPGNRGEVVISKLLSFVPDRIFIEGSKAYLVNPLSSDSSVYSYGSTHPVLAGEYRRGAWLLNRVQVEGYDTQASQAIIVDSFAWDEIERLYDRLRQVEDRNIDTVTKAEQRGEAYLRGAEIESASGAMVIPVNCGQQLYDVIDITDTRAGLETAKKRVLGLVLRYHPPRGEYEQRLSLGAV